MQSAERATVKHVESKTEQKIISSDSSLFMKLEIYLSDYDKGPLSHRYEG